MVRENYFTKSQQKSLKNIFKVYKEYNKKYTLAAIEIVIQKQMLMLHLQNEKEDAMKMDNLNQLINVAWC